jgi:hypothetical protein
MRDRARSAPPSLRIAVSVMHKQGEQQNDRQRDAENPEQETSTKAHVSLRIEVVFSALLAYALDDHEQNDHADRHSQQP